MGCKDLKDHPVCGQGHLPVAQVAQSPVQPGLGHCQGPGDFQLHTASLGTLCQGLTSSQAGISPDNASWWFLIFLTDASYYFILLLFQLTALLAKVLVWGGDELGYQDVFIVLNIAVYYYEKSIMGETEGLSSSKACLTVDGEEWLKEDKYSGRKVHILVSLCMLPSVTT